MCIWIFFRIFNSVPYVNLTNHIQLYNVLIIEDFKYILIYGIASYSHLFSLSELPGLVLFIFPCES